MTAREPDNRAELYHLQVGTMQVRGSVTDKGNGRCTALVHYEDSATTNKQTAEYRLVDRQTLADLYRTWADNIAPQAEGMECTFWCDLHQAELEGQPQWTFDPNARTWELSFVLMECTHDPDQGCRPSWALARVALSRKGVA